MNESPTQVARSSVVAGRSFVAGGATAVRLAPLWAALLAMAPFFAVLAGRTEFFFDDHFRFSQPIAAMVAEALRQHRLPLWNPWVMTGTPLVAERGSMVAHPGMLLALVMQPSHAVGTLMVLLLGVLAAGATAFLQVLSVRATLAVCIGAAIGLSGPALSYTSAAPFLATLACWPWILLAALRLAEEKDGVNAGGLCPTAPARGGSDEPARRPFSRTTLFGGLALGLALLGGDLPGALLAAVVALFVFRARGGSFRRDWWRLVAVGTIGLLVGAGAWFPVVWALPLSERGAGIAAVEAGRWSLHPGELFGFLWPHPLGLPLPRFSFWPFRWLGGRNFLHSVWIGSVLALAAFGSLRKGSDRAARTLTVLACALLLAATGKWTPMWTVIRPIFTFLRYPSKLAAPAALMLALSGGVMLESLLREPRRLRRLFVAVVTVAALGATVGVAVQAALARRAAAPTEIASLAAGALRRDTLRVALLATLGAGVLVLAERRRLAMRWAAAVVAMLLFLEVFTTTETLSWTRPPVTPARAAFLPASDHGGRGPRLMRLEEVSLGRLALADQAFTQEQLRQATLQTPLSNAIEHVGVMEPYGLYLGEVAAAMAEMVAIDPVALAEVTATDMMLAEPASRAPWLMKAVDDGRLRFAGRVPAGALVFRVEHAWPRSFWASSDRLDAEVHIPRALAQGGHTLFIAKERMLIRGAYSSAATPPAVDGAHAISPVMPTVWQPGMASYRVSAVAPGLLVEMDAFMPGWHVYVDGKEQPILQANAFGRAVMVPAGDHVVDWRFRPRLVVASLVIGWVTLLGCLLVAGLRFFRRRLTAAPS